MRMYPSRPGRASSLTFRERFHWWWYRKDIRQLQEQIERAQGSKTLSLSNRIFQAIGENAEHQAEMRQESAGTQAEIRNLMHEFLDLAKRQRAHGSSVRSDDGRTLIEVSSRLQSKIDKWRESVVPPSTKYDDTRSNVSGLDSLRSSVMLSSAPSYMGIDSFMVPEYPRLPADPTKDETRRPVFAMTTAQHRTPTHSRSSRTVPVQPARHDNTSGQDHTPLSSASTQVRAERNTDLERAAEDRDSGYQSVSRLLQTRRRSEAQSSIAEDQKIAGRCEATSTAHQQSQSTQLR